MEFHKTIETTKQIRVKLRSKPICIHTYIYIYIHLYISMHADAVCIFRILVGMINSPHLWQNSYLCRCCGHRFWMLQNGFSSTLGTSIGQEKQNCQGFQTHTQTCDTCKHNDNPHAENVVKPLMENRYNIHLSSTFIDGLLMLRKHLTSPLDMPCGLIISGTVGNSDWLTAIL